MWQTLLINLKLHLREKTQLFWLFAFPIILATMFNGMFGNIAESFELHTLDVACCESMTADCDSPSHSRRNRPCPM